LQNATKVVFYVPRMPLSLNTLLRMHWRRRAQEQKIWDNVIGAHWLAHHKAIFTEPVILRYVLAFPSNRKRDLDNYIGGTKYVTDALKKTFLFRDDAEWIKRIELEFQPGEEGLKIAIETAEGA